MTRIFLVVFLLLMLILVSGCGSNNTTPTQAGGTPLPDVSTIVAKTLAAISTASPTPTLPASVHSATPTATLQIILPTHTATNTPSETPPATMPTPEVKNAAEDSPTPTAANPPNAAASKDDCIDKAGFYADVTVPDNTLFPKNTQFTKIWRFRNVGTCTWGDGYLLVFANGHIMDGPPSIPVPNAAPGDVIDISVNLKSPSEGGTYAGDWQFQNANGKRFGVNSHGEDMFWVIIKVDWGPGVGPTATPPPVNCAYERNPAYEAQILQLINNARTTNGLPALTLQNQLNAAAMTHSADMACLSYLDHNGSDKSTHTSRLTAHGYKYTYESENIYAGGDAQDAFEWWMNSPIHRGNILNGKATQIGIGYAYYASSQFGGYYTLNFARP